MKKIKTLLFTFVFSISASMASVAEDELEPIPNQIIVESNLTWDGEKIKYPRTRKPNVRIQISEFRPGEDVPWHIHETPLYIYVMEGEFTVELLDGTKQTTLAGDAFIEVVNTIHTGYNEGDTNSKLLIVFTGKQNLGYYTPVTCAPDDCDFGPFLKNGKFDWSAALEAQN